MSVRLLLLAAMCSLAASQSGLVMKANTFLVEMDEGTDPEPKYILRLQYIVTLQCSMMADDQTALEEASISWQKAGSNDTLDMRFQVTNSLSEDKKNLSSVLTLRRPKNEDIVNYTCTGSAKGRTSAVGNAEILSRPLITFSVEDSKLSDVALWPGENLEIKCVVGGNPSGPAQWFKESEGSVVSLSNSTVLNLTDLSYERDRGYLTCMSHNRFGQNSGKIYLRVKNPKAYLAPLIIIIIEVIIMVVIVVSFEMYTRRKRKQEQNDFDAAAAYKVD